VDFLRVALEENVLELVALITQHVAAPELKADAAVVLDALAHVYGRLSPRDVMLADEELLLTRDGYAISLVLAESCRRVHAA
jgi:hypothetical protein